jgi:hypothetical protein
MIRRVALLVAGSLLVPALASAGPSTQEVVLAAKPAVALVTARVDAEVTLDCGRGPVTVKAAPVVETGTGWFVDGRGWLITSAHVVDPAFTQPPGVVRALRNSAVERACIDPMLAQRGSTREQQAELEEQLRRRAEPRATVTTRPSIAVVLSNGTTLAADVKKFSALLRPGAGDTPLAGAGRDLALLRVPDGVYPALAVGDESPRIGTALHVIGFPSVVSSHELLGQSARAEASVTTGSVSGFKQNASGQRLIQTDAAAAQGNSGGPAIGDDGVVAGVLTFVTLSGGDGGVVQGFNFLIPARDVRHFLAGTDVASPRAGAFDAAWRGGVDDLFAGRYRSAVRRLEEADRLLPGLPDVKRALDDAKHPPPRPFPWAWVTVGLALVSGAGYSTYLYRRWQRNRFRIPATEVATLIESGQPPLMLDVRGGDMQRPGTLRIPGSVRLTEEALAEGRVPASLAKDQPVVAFCT